MDDPPKFLLPKPDFSKKAPVVPKSAPHFLTPSGMTLLPRDRQPPPMYGPKGSTIPPKFLIQHKNEGTPQERQFCEPCEMELQSVDDFRRHRAQHERCPVDGCKFKAHPSVMDKHVTELHASGIFDKIKKISTPEEIAAWREERRKKYPTVANTQMRQLAQDQRQRRGERLEQNKARFGRHEDRKRARNVENNTQQQPSGSKPHQTGRKERKDRTREKRPPKKFVKPEEKQPAVTVAKINEANEDKASSGIRMFEGTSKMKDYKHEKVNQTQTKNVLSNLLGMYGSDEDDDDERDGTEEEIIEKFVDEKEVLDNIAKLPNSEDGIREEVFNDKQREPEIQEMITSQEIHLNSSLTLSTNNSQFDSKIELPADQAPAGIDCKTSVIEPEAPLVVNNPSCGLQQKTDDSTIAMEDKSSSDEAPEEAPIERATAVPCTTNPSFSTSNVEGEATASKRVKLENRKKSLQQKRKYGLDYRKIRLRKQNTMLEKLLEPDIRHERNVLLQCVRFVCQNNFFGIGSENTSNKNTTLP